MPLRGGAIQLAILPRSYTGRINDRTCVLSTSVGSHSPYALLPFVGRDLLAVRCGFDAGECTHLAVERNARQPESSLQARLIEDLVPPVDAVLAVGHVLAPEIGVETDERGHLGLPDVAVDQRIDHDGVVGQAVVVLPAFLRPTTLETGGVVVRDVRRRFAAEEVERDAVVEVQILLDDVERNHSVAGDVIGVLLEHHLDRTFDDAVDTGRAHEHVMAFFFEHELAGA